VCVTFVSVINFSVLWQYLILPASASCFNVPSAEFGKETVLPQKVTPIEVLTHYVLIFQWRMNTGSVLKTYSKSSNIEGRHTVLCDDDVSLVSFSHFWVRRMLSHWITIWYHLCYDRLPDEQVP